MIEQEFELLERPSVPALDAILGKKFPLLDHGFVRCVDYMGNDAAITQAARISYGKGTKSVSEDRGLIRYLLSHKHTTPFEMCELKLHIKMPIFVARQWIRHRTASVNEYSARYSVLDNEFYTPEVEDLKPQSKTNKQGREGAYDERTGSEIRQEIMAISRDAYEKYDLLQEENDETGYGLARELSRMVLPVNFYTQWYWKINLHNLFNFLRLRADSHAQYEIRVYADVICQMVKLWVPLAYAAFEEFVKEAATYSKSEQVALQAILRRDFKWEDLRHNTRWFVENMGFSKREFEAFCDKLGAPTLPVEDYGS